MKSWPVSNDWLTSTNSHPSNVGEDCAWSLLTLAKHDAIVKLLRTFAESELELVSVLTTGYSPFDVSKSSIECDCIAGKGKC